MTRRRAAAACVLVAVAVLTPSCSGGGRGDDRATITVLAAASLTDAFTEIGRRFERVNPRMHVRFSFGASDGLAAQIRNGAPADVFASASERWMDEVERDPGVFGRQDFARNRLTVVVPPSNPAAIQTLNDLAAPGVKLVLAAEGVPAGDYAREVLENAGIADEAGTNLVSNEVDVRGVLQKVASGDADAGIVYVTDVTSDVRAVPIPDDVNVVADYPIAVVGADVEKGPATSFVAFVVGPGRSVLRAAGFLSPEA